MPQYAGSDPMNTSTKCTFTVVSWVNARYEYGIDEMLQLCFADVADIKGTVVPGDTTDITATAREIVKSMTRANRIEKADLIADLIT